MSDPVTRGGSDDEAWKGVVLALGKDLAPFYAVLRRRWQSEVEKAFLEDDKDFSPCMMEAIRCDSDEDLEAIKNFDLSLAFNANDMMAVINHGFTSAIKAFELINTLAPAEFVPTSAQGLHGFMSIQLDIAQERLQKATNTTGEALAKDVRIATLSGEKRVDYKPQVIKLHDEIIECLGDAFAARLHCLACWLVIEQKEIKAEALCQQVEEYESRFDKQNNPFGLPLHLEVFKIRDIKEAAKKNGYTAGGRQLYQHLKEWKHGASWKYQGRDEWELDRPEIEGFLRGLRPRQRKKANCTVTAQRKSSDKT
jgi:hypothetical protein